MSRFIYCLRFSHAYAMRLLHEFARHGPVRYKLLCYLSTFKQGYEGCLQGEHWTYFDDPSEAGIEEAECMMEDSHG